MIPMLETNSTVKLIIFSTTMYYYYFVKTMFALSPHTNRKSSEHLTVKREIIRPNSSSSSVWFHTSISFSFFFLFFSPFFFLFSFLSFFISLFYIIILLFLLYFKTALHLYYYLLQYKTFNYYLDQLKNL